MSQKESEWKKEFEKVMGCIPECASGLYEDVGCPAHGYDAMKSVKFFRGVLSNREKEIAEEVEKILERHISWKPTEGYESEEECWFQKGLMAEAKLLKKDLLQILKH